jgi:hypothetical protein
MPLFKRSMKVTRLLLVNVTLMTFLQSCGKDSSDITCPVLVQYGAQFQKQASAELEDAIKTHPKLAEMVTDYYGLRQACRAIEKKYLTDR